MDKDISEMFKEKNKEIFKNSLTLEMERNLETLKNTTDNCVALEINKLFLFFKKYFHEINIDYKKEELLGLLYRERKDINDLVNSKIEEKKNRIKEEFLNKEDTVDVFDEVFIDDYYNVLVEETNKLNEALELDLKKLICTEFSPAIIKKYKLETVDQLDRIHSRIDVLFRDSIINKIKEQTKFRDESLKNMAVESFNKYLELNKSTIE